VKVPTHGAHGHLSADRAGGVLKVSATASAKSIKLPTLRLGGVMFSTSLRAEDSCEATLLEGDQDQTAWDFPIELGANQKLRRL
jgi:hypothetical protein